MNESFEPRPRRASVAACPAEVLLREYLDDLFRTIDHDHVRDSCARGRALACVIRGVVEPLAMNHATQLTQRDLAEIAFGELEDQFGWYGEDASVLELYAGLWPSLEDGHRRAEEYYRADPYSRHSTYWHRCVEAGFADLSDWLDANEDHGHSAVIAVVERAAIAVGDE